MARLAPEDRALLKMIAEDGGRLHVVTADRGVKDQAASALVRWAYGMCDEDYMRLERISGDANNPMRQQTYDFILTKKAERVATRPAD